LATAPPPPPHHQQFNTVVKPALALPIQHMHVVKVHGAVLLLNTLPPLLLADPFLPELSCGFSSTDAVGSSTIAVGVFSFTIAAGGYSSTAALCRYSSTTAVGGYFLQLLLMDTLLTLLL
jgi:hypothetical protein